MLEEEYLLVTIGIITAKGYDVMTLALAEALTAAGILKVPKTWRLV